MSRKSDAISRRELMALTGGAVLGWTFGITDGQGGSPPDTTGRPPADLIERIERRIIWNGRAGGISWFHPRACMVPATSEASLPLGLMTLQSISGSDYYGPVHWSATSDLGKTWSDPRPIDGLSLRKVKGTLHEGVCDVVPEYHAKTRTVLAIGHNVWYEKGALRRPQLKRHPVYAVRSPDGRWSGARKLAWDDPRGAAIYTCGCAQRVTLDDGDLLIALSFAPDDKTPRSVATVRCSFDGREVALKEVGNELRHPVKRGLLEPSLARFQGRYYMTIRAEDNRGYVAVSDDGLHWPEMRPWQWDDGEPLVLSTTQQHWLPHSDGLFLVYTRKAEHNVNVMRWRAPLYVARVDPGSLRLFRSTERTVFPLIGDGIKDPNRVARMGNFHTTAATPDVSWVTVGEVMPGYHGDVLMATIRWNRPNRRL